MSIYGLTDIEITDDLNVTMDPDSYKDAPSNTIPQPGAYRLRVVSMKPRKDQDGNIVLADGKFPTIVLEQLEILEPEDDGRKFGAFLDVRTKPVKRFDGYATDLGDITRSFDQTRGWSGTSEGLAVLEELAQEGTFRAQLGWSAYDSQFAKSQLEAAGLAGLKWSEMTSDQQKVAGEIYKKARLSTKDFPVSNGKRVPFGRNPHSGNELEARLTVQRYIPSGAENVKLGAFTPKA